MHTTTTRPPRATASVPLRKAFLKKIPAFLSAVFPATAVAVLGLTGCETVVTTHHYTFTERPPSPPSRGDHGSTPRSEWTKVVVAPNFDVKKYPKVVVRVETLGQSDAAPAARNVRGRVRPGARQSEAFENEDDVRGALIAGGFTVFDRSNLASLQREWDIQNSISGQAVGSIAKIKAADCVLRIRLLSTEAAYETWNWRLTHDGAGNWREAGEMKTAKSPKYCVEFIDINSFEVVWMALGPSVGEIIAKLPTLNGTNNGAQNGSNSNSTTTDEY